MRTLFDHFLVKVQMRLGWSADGRGMLESIRQFEATEDDSAWHLLSAAGRAEDPALAARLFAQALEESHHAEVFRDLYRRVGGRALDKASVERVPLFAGEPLWKLLVFCAVGEKSAARRFQSIANNLPAGEFRASLTKIIAEEAGHVHLATDLLAKTGQPLAVVRAETRAIKLRRLREAWLRAGRALTLLLSRALLALIFHVIGPLVAVAARAREKTTVVRSTPPQIALARRSAKNSGPAWSHPERMKP